VKTHVNDVQQRCHAVTTFSRTIWSLLLHIIQTFHEAIFLSWRSASTLSRYEALVLFHFPRIPGRKH